MKRLLQYTLCWLCLGCFMAANLKPLVAPAATAKPRQVMLDVHHESMPCDGKEQKTEWFKNVARLLAPIIPVEEEIATPDYLAFKSSIVKQVFQRIILPPPKLLA
ncbi:MAG: hypothetical protein IT258_04375 [Saprospiraceae bacterium]|nr:hypothetical protein [Saprospiraceae bacterium]